MDNSPRIKVTCLFAQSSGESIISFGVTIRRSYVRRLHVVVEGLDVGGILPMIIIMGNRGIVIDGK